MNDTVKIFEEPMRIKGYMTDEDLHNLNLYGTYYMIIKQKYNHEDKYELSFERLEFDYHCDWIWETDWWEGQQDVLLLGYFEVPNAWSEKEKIRFIDFLKEYKE